MHETNTFSDVATGIEAFKEREWSYGEEICRHHSGVRSFVGGMLDEAELLGIEALPTFGAWAVPSGRITREAFDRIRSELLRMLREAGPADAICLALHGAGVAEGVEDIEGELLRAVREQAGIAIPIVATLDLHANVTPLMVEHADLLLGNLEYPHIDSYERGREVVGFAARMAAGELKPEMHLVKLPLLVPTLATSNPVIAELNASCQEIEAASHDVLDCTLYHGFPYADIRDAGLSVLAVTDGDPELARRAAEQIAEQIWTRRERLFPVYPSPDAGVRQAEALAAVAHPVVINETSDNPGAGTPGDGTRLLRAMLELRPEHACFGFICDPETARLAHAAGIGAEIAIRLGGKTDNRHGKPIEARATVVTLTDGKFTTSSPMGQGTQMNAGPSARLQIESVEVIVTSVRNQVFDEQIFALHGIDVRQMNIVALKSSQHFRAAFEPIAASIVTVDSPGLSMFDFTHFPFERVRRPIFPLDPLCEYLTECASSGGR